MNFMLQNRLYKKCGKYRQSKMDQFLTGNQIAVPKFNEHHSFLNSFFAGQPNREISIDRTTMTRDPKKTPNHKNTITSSKFSANLNTTTSEPYVIMAITEGRNHARGEVGIASIDLNSPQLNLCQLSDDLWYTGTIIKIQFMDPNEILIPNTICNNILTESKITKIIDAVFPNITIKPTPRRHFNDADAIEMIEIISCINYEIIKLAIENKYYALSAAGALLKYLKECHNINFGNKSLKIQYETRYATMTIDMETSTRLELLRPLTVTREKKTCLFSYMDNCITSIGKRALRARILEPCCDINTIKQYHQAIDELMSKESLLYSLRTILKRFYHVDRLMKLAVVVPQDDNIKAAETMIGQTLMLKTCLESIPNLYDILSSVESKNLTDIRDGLEDPRYAFIVERIESCLHSDAHNYRSSGLYFQRLYAVKPEISPVLDVSRKLYSQLIDEINENIISLSVERKITLQMHHTVTLGFHILLNVDRNKETPTLPDDFIVLSKKGFRYFVTTQKIKDLNLRVRDVVDEVNILSNLVISEMLMTIRQEIDCIYLLTGLITELDLIQSFATLSANSDFCCPTFGEELRVVHGVHPLLEFGRSKSLPVPNNIIATPEYNFFVITGPNMGGKTVYIKMIAILQIMSQIGCYIPARSGQFRICDKLFSRIGFEDNVERGTSSFAFEMHQMEYIFENITANSLVIIDELGRSTNPEEGELLAWRISEKLIFLKGYTNDGKYFDQTVTELTNESSLNNSTMDISKIDVKIKYITSPFIFLTTHFLSLSKLAQLYFNVINVHLSAEEKQKDGKLELTYTHQVQMGVTPLCEYGLALARAVKFPLDVIPRAEEIYKNLTEINQTQNNSNFISNAISNHIDCDEKENDVNKTLPTLSEKSKGSFEIERKLYDLYANIASIYRKYKNDSNSVDANKELNDILNNFINSQSQEILNDIKNTTTDDSIWNDNAKITLESGKNLDTADQTISTSTECNSINKITDYSKLSYHSLVRRFGKENLNEIPADEDVVVEASTEEHLLPVLELSNNDVTPSENKKISYFNTNGNIGIPDQKTTQDNHSDRDIIMEDFPEEENINSSQDVLNFTMGSPFKLKSNKEKLDFFNMSLNQTQFINNSQNSIDDIFAELGNDNEDFEFEQLMSNNQYFESLIGSPLNNESILDGQNQSWDDFWNNIESPPIDLCNSANQSRSTIYNMSSLEPLQSDSFDNCRSNLWNTQNSFHSGLNRSVQLPVFQSSGHSSLRSNYQQSMRVENKNNRQEQINKAGQNFMEKYRIKIMTNRGKPNPKKLQQSRLLYRSPMCSASDFNSKSMSIKSMSDNNSIIENNDITASNPKRQVSFGETTILSNSQCSNATFLIPRLPIDLATPASIKCHQQDKTAMHHCSSLFIAATPPAKNPSKENDLWIVNYNNLETPRSQKSDSENKSIEQEFNDENDNIDGIVVDLFSKYFSD